MVHLLQAVPGFVLNPAGITLNPRKKMKPTKLILLAGAFLAGLTVIAQPILTFEITDPHIVVSELFDINLYIEYDAFEETGGGDAELLSFGYDFSFTGSSSLMDVTVPSDSFFDVATDLTLMGGNVQGVAFPGLTDNNLLISTFSLNALAEGPGSLSVSGLVDDFSGAFYLGFDPDEDFQTDTLLLYERDLVGETSWMVEPVPEPREVALIGTLTLLALMAFRYRRR